MALTISPSPFGSLTVTVAETQGSITVNTVATSPSVLSMALGVPGPKGDTGAAGSNGVGVPTGGTTGQALVKSSGTNYDTTWANINSSAWGNITGTLSSQTDLQNALDGKLSLTGGYVDGDFKVLGFNFIKEDGALYIGSSLGDYYSFIDTSGIYLYLDNELTQGLTLQASGITFSDNTTQASAFIPSNYLTASSIASTYLTQSSAASTYFTKPTGTSAEYIDGTGSLQTFPSVTSVGKMVTAVYNNTGATIPKGSVVYINGKHGSLPTIELARADEEATSAYTIGLTDASIANNASGNIITAGTIENLSTNAYSDGTPLYLSATTAGALTDTKQFAPNHYVKIGTVINAHPTAGTIFIKIENGYQLDELSDCAVTAPANNNVLTYESSSSLWKDKSVSSALGYAPANQTLGNLSSSSTARTNLGLGTMAVETASNYLTTATAASTYTTKANNLSDLSNTATARTNLGLAYATDAQVIAGTSASTVLTPSLATNNLLNWTVCGTSGVGTNTSVGTVTTSSYGSRCQLTATTAGQYAIVYPSNTAVATYTTSGTSYSDCNYSKRIKIYGRIYVSAVSNINCYFIFGRGIGAPATIGNLSNKGFGIRIQGTGAVELQVHTGTTLSNVTSSFTPTTNTLFDCLIDSLGDGNVNLYINGSLVATSSGGPTGTGGASFPLLIQEISSTGSSTTANFYITGKALYMA